MQSRPARKADGRRASSSRTEKGCGLADEAVLASGCGFFAEAAGTEDKVSCCDARRKAFEVVIAASERGGGMRIGRCLGGWRGRVCYSVGGVCLQHKRGVPRVQYAIAAAGIRRGSHKIV